MQWITQIVSLWQIFKLKAKQRYNMPSNHNFVSINCNNILRTTHVPNTYVVSVTISFIHYCIWPDSISEYKRSVTNQSAGAQGNSTAEVNTYFSFKGKPRNNILLATAILEIQSSSGQHVPCRALLDSASQAHFITKKCARLRITRTQTHSSIKGIRNGNTATPHSVSKQLRSRHTDWHTTLDCDILSDTIGATPSTQLDTSTWKIPNGIKLADEHFDQPGNVDLLIGAELFYGILRWDRRTRSGHYPVLQGTILGWTISGRTPVTTTTRNDLQRTFLLQRDNRLKQNPNRLREMEPMEQSMSTRYQTCNQQHNWWVLLDWCF